MNPLIPLRDIWLVARFELLRNLRTWRALALTLLYIIVMGGGAYVFTRFVGTLENALAETLMVPQTEVPGAMLDKLMREDSLRGPLGAMIGDPALLDSVLQWPVLTIFHLWMGMLLVPFLAASTSAESIVLDTQSRAVRFECLRTGRVELVTGRFVGQLLLLMAATLLSVGATWTVGMVYMVGNDPWILASHLIWLTPRLWVVALPFIGLGLAASQATESANMARVVAIVVTLLSLILCKRAEQMLKRGGGIAWDVILQLMPWNWMDGMWRPGAGWLVEGGVLILLGFAAMAMGLPVFLKRNL